MSFQINVQGGKVDIVEKDRKLEHLLDQLRNMLKSTKYTQSLVIKPKQEVIYDSSIFAQLEQEVTRFDAIYFSWSGVFLIPAFEESASARQESSQSEKMETVKRRRDFDHMLERIRNMVESTHYTQTVVIKPKDKAIYNHPMLIQLYQELTRVGAVWFSSPRVFMIPTCEKPAASARQESSQDEICTSQSETRTPVTEEHSDQCAEVLLNDRINIEIEKLKAYFGRKMTKSAVVESVAFLLSKELKPEEIAAKVGVNISTIYRHIPKEKTENSVST
jgi:hypothetical protein